MCKKYLVSEQKSQNKTETIKLMKTSKQTTEI